MFLSLTIVLTYLMRCNTKALREEYGEYVSVGLGDIVRVLDDTIVVYVGDMPLCIRRSWRLTYVDSSALGLSEAEVLVLDNNSLVVRLLRKGEYSNLKDLARLYPIIVHAFDANERGLTGRVFRVGEYAEVISRESSAESLIDCVKPKRGVNIVVADVPMIDNVKFRKWLQELVRLGESIPIEYHGTMMSDICIICGGRMERRGRKVYCRKCGISVDRDVNACWSLARNILGRLGRFRDQNALRELFQSLLLSPRSEI